MSIVSNINKLQDVCRTVPTLEEGERIAAKLLKELTESKSGIGLAANQIGINKRVCVVNVKEPIYFVNPKITNREGEVQFVEGCLSFPNKSVKTKRNVYVTVESDNLGKVVFGPGGGDDDEANYQDLLECVCVQHEIDHLDGITMYDREFKNEPIINGINAPKKYGRNERVVIEKDGNTKEVKYKKAEPLLDDGWVITGG